MLTDANIRAAKPAAKQYEMRDGAGLSLLVTPAGTKVWRLRYRTTNGDRKRHTIGSYPDVKLARARVEAGKLRGQVLSGHDPAAAAAKKKNVTHETVDDLVRQYIEERSPGWRPSTRSTYGSTLATFAAWARAAKVKRATDLTADKLARLRSHLVSLPRRAKKKGGGRRDVVSTGEKRSPSAINADLRAIKTMLQVLRSARRLPNIKSRDEILDNLKLVPADQAKARPMKPAAIRKLLEAGQRHDAATWNMTRQEKDEGVAGTTPKHEAITPVILIVLLSGMRMGEALALTWDDVDLEESEIRVRASKTGRERSVDLAVSPALAKLLASMKLRGGGQGRVVGSHTRQTVSDARRRLIADYGAPQFHWSTKNSRGGKRSAPTLRSTCGCYLTCAPSIYGGASVYMSAAQLGHGVQVAERHYLGTLRRIPRDATTVEAAMEIEPEVVAARARQTS